MAALAIAPRSSAQPPPSTPPAAPSVERRGDALVLSEPVRFEYDRAIIRPESFALLRALVVVLQSDPSMRVCVEGHLGVERFPGGLVLSRDRANSVRGFLVDHGIDAARIETVGWEATRPLVPLPRRAGTVAWRRASAANARIELRVLVPGAPPCHYY